MKIISKYKDYYDYLQGIYGVDERLVLDRRQFTMPIYLSNGTIEFIIGNKRVTVLHQDGVYYCGESDMIKLGGKLIIDSVTNRKSYRVQYKNSLNKISTLTVSVEPLPINKNNRKSECAIYTTQYGKILPYPKLETFNVQKAFSPHDIWVELSAYLGEQITAKEPIVPVGDDKVRIISAGFDLKTSFRH